MRLSIDPGIVPNQEIDSKLEFWTVNGEQETGVQIRADGSFRDYYVHCNTTNEFIKTPETSGKVVILTTDHHNHALPLALPLVLTPTAAANLLSS